MKVKREYYKTDQDGKKRVREYDTGIVVEILEEPSAEYIANMPPFAPEPEPRNYLAELDDLKARVEKMEMGRM